LNCTDFTSAVQSGTAYLDSQYSLGYANDLIPGYDCPTYATYLNISLSGEYTTKDTNGKTGVCMSPQDDL
jgi:hypothetical protein